MDEASRPTPAPSNVPPPFELGLTVRFSDLDGMGHVNHAVFLTYLEEARVAFFKERTGRSEPHDFDFIMARAEIDYKRPITLGERVTVRMWVERIGTKSFTFGYELVVADVVAAKARTVQVFYDYPQHRSIEIPDDMREVLDHAMREG